MEGFLDLPVSAQALYFHLGMHGDDDGFVASPQKITRSVGCNADDLRILAARNFIIPFDSGIVVITDWKRNNTLKNDRYTRTDFLTEMDMLVEDKTGRYVLGSNVDPDSFQNGSSLEPQHNITEINKDKQNTDKQSTGKQSVGGGGNRAQRPYDTRNDDNEDFNHMRNLAMNKLRSYPG